MEICTNACCSLQAALWDMNYTKITAVMEDEKTRVDEVTARSAPAKELAARRLPDIVELVKKQRLNTLERGAFFPNLKEKEKEKEKEKGRQKSSFFCRLHPNHMAIQWAEFETATTTETIPYEHLTNKGTCADGLAGSCSLI